MLAPVSQYARRLSTRCKEQSSRSQFLCPPLFHWHKLGHAQSSKQCNQSRTTGTSNKGPAWSNKCTCQISSICNPKETWQEDGLATVHACSSPEINNLRSSNWSKGKKNRSLSFFLPIPPSVLISLPASLVFSRFLPLFLYLSIHSSIPSTCVSFLSSLHSLSIEGMRNDCIFASLHQSLLPSNPTLLFHCSMHTTKKLNLKQQSYQHRRKGNKYSFSLATLPSPPGWIPVPSSPTHSFLSILLLSLLFNLPFCQMLAAHQPCRCLASSKP